MECMNIQFHMTNRCNLCCKHCYHGKYTQETISLGDFNRGDVMIVR